jgi:hypothetical protein
MKRGLVLVEGQTEEQFVDDCLAPYLLAKGLVLGTTIVKTKRVVGGSHAKGGVLSYGQVRRDLGFLLHDTNASVITTLLDYYALPTDFPGMDDRPAGTAKDRVEHVEATWAGSVGDTRFVPHLVLHELEAWVYAEPSCLEPWMFDDDVKVVAAIAAVARAHQTPEDIDEGPHTAPSKRLFHAFAGYQKTLHGPLAISAIGIDRIRAVCPHVSRWIDRLEAIASAP